MYFSLHATQFSFEKCLNFFELNFLEIFWKKIQSVVLDCNFPFIGMQRERKNLGRNLLLFLLVSGEEEKRIVAAG